MRSRIKEWKEMCCDNRTENPFHTLLLVRTLDDQRSSPIMNGSLRLCRFLVGARSRRFGNDD